MMKWLISHLFILQCKLQVEQVDMMIRIVIGHWDWQVNMVLSKGSNLFSQKLQNLRLGGLLKKHQSSTKYHVYDYILLTNEREPETFQEAKTHKHKDSQMKAM